MAKHNVQTIAVLTLSYRRLWHRSGVSLKDEVPRSRKLFLPHCSQINDDAVKITSLPGSLLGAQEHAWIWGCRENSSSRLRTATCRNDFWLGAMLSKRTVSGMNRRPLLNNTINNTPLLNMCRNTKSSRKIECVYECSRVSNKAPWTRLSRTKK